MTVSACFPSLAVLALLPLLVSSPVETFPSREAVHCPAGTLLVPATGDDQPEVCQACREGFYNSHDGHRLPHCFQCTPFNEYAIEQVLVENCSRTHDTVIACVEGFYLDHSDASWVACVHCTDCRLLGMFEAAPCSPGKDAECCPQDGMVIVDGACALPVMSSRERNEEETSTAQGHHSGSSRLGSSGSPKGNIGGDTMVLVLKAFFLLATCCVLVYAVTYLAKVSERCVSNLRARETGQDHGNVELEERESVSLFR